MSMTASPMSLRAARAVGSEMVEVLRPYCERIAVAGSIRRGPAWPTTCCYGLAYPLLKPLVNAAHRTL